LSCVHGLAAHNQKNKVQIVRIALAFRRLIEGKGEDGATGAHREGR